ncbi:septum formation initiator family protein [Patescibacteria group bacterium]|nr:septum formation initiator family protein [Patescibacteria group bacterium]
MGKYLTVTRKKNRKGVRNRTLSQPFRVGPVTLTIAIVVLFCVLSLFFLTQVFQSSTTGFEVSALQDEIEELKDQNKDLEVKAAELRSLDSIERSVEEINMVPVQDMVYIKSTGSVVAAANDDL